MKASADKHPRIMVLATGGTIASLADTRCDEHYHSANVPIKELVNNIPEISAIAEVECEQFSQLISHRITEDFWIDLSNHVNGILSRVDIDGIVITHGTDTIEETAYFLNLVIHTTKPIVFTGAMKPLNALDTDGYRNLFSSIVVAANPISHNKGVLVVMNDSIHAARDVLKVNNGNLDSFKSSCLLGFIRSSNVYFNYQSLKKHTDASEFNIDSVTKLPKVHIVYGYVGCGSIMLDATLNDGAIGIISIGMGKGFQPQELTDGLISAAKDGVIVVRCSRVSEGIVTERSTFDDKHGFVAGGGLSPYKARILLALALGRTKKLKNIQQIFWEY